jgi:hypothetical protein
MKTTIEMAVYLPQSNGELEALLPAQPERLLCGLAEKLRGTVFCADQDVGHGKAVVVRRPRVVPPDAGKRGVTQSRSSATHLTGLSKPVKPLEVRV